MKSEAWPHSTSVPEKGPNADRPPYYPAGQAPWERVREKLGPTSEIPAEGGHKMVGWDPLPRPRIGDLAPYEIDMVYRGKLEPLRVRLLAKSDESPAGEPESASPRDLLVGEFDTDLAHGEDDLCDIVEHELQPELAMIERGEQAPSPGRTAEDLRKKIEAYEERIAFIRDLAKWLEEGKIVSEEDK